MKRGHARYLSPPSDSIWRDNFSVAIVYEDRAAGERAMQVLSKLVHEFGDELHFRPHLWRFDVLSHPNCRQVAESEGNRAILLIVSTSSDGDLPIAVREWLVASLASRHEKGGVVALFGPENHIEDENSPRLNFLRDAAYEAGLQFFRPHAWEFPIGYDRIYFRDYSETATHASESLLHPEIANRGWGINE